ncbi:uncharacterized protein LOC123657660 [Melitaea cinxia]|uniref:uncharacterized protein LOC123657660 n=1 Tax=Melitaea cinxia TaxID=113334 RepID=UPI001E271E62|nr:uncharacterized protein LOC123657660 [Melitaea cinxia]
MSSGQRPVLKPEMVLEYNRGKKGIDVSDQLSSYNSPTRKSITWYKKIAVDLLSIAVVNSCLIFNELQRNSGQKKLAMLSAHEIIIKNLLQVRDENQTYVGRPQSLPENKHTFEKMTKEPGRKTNKKRCKGCYNKLISEGQSSKLAGTKASKVITWCPECKIVLCRPCYNTLH